MLSLTLVYFYAVSGAMALDDFVNRIGDRISGSLNVVIGGKRDYCVEDDCEETLTGIIIGDFEGVLADYDGKGGVNDKLSARKLTCFYHRVSIKFESCNQSFVDGRSSTTG